MKNVILIKLETRFQRVLQWKKMHCQLWWWHCTSCLCLFPSHFVSLPAFLLLLVCQGLLLACPLSFVFLFPICCGLFLFSIQFIFSLILFRLPFCVGSHVFACMDAGAVNKASYLPITVSVFGPPPFCKLQQSISGDGLWHCENVSGIWWTTDFVSVYIVCSVSHITLLFNVHVLLCCFTFCFPAFYLSVFPSNVQLQKWYKPQQCQQVLNTVWDIFQKKNKQKRRSLRKDQIIWLEWGTMF